MGNESAWYDRLEAEVKALVGGEWEEADLPPAERAGPRYPWRKIILLQARTGQTVAEIRYPKDEELQAECSACRRGRWERFQASGKRVNEAAAVTEVYERLLTRWEDPAELAYVQAGHYPPRQPQYTDAQRASFEEAVKPAVRWLRDHGNPHAQVVIDQEGAELSVGVLASKVPFPEGF